MVSCSYYNAAWNNSTKLAWSKGFILLLPIYNVWQLQMPIHRKLAVIGIFLLGGLVTITGIIRLHFLTLAYASLKDPLKDTLFNDISCKSLPKSHDPGLQY